MAHTYIVCGVVIKQNGKYLLVQEKQPKVYGMWNLPGGRVDEGESLEQAAVREAKEEVGYDVSLGDKIQVLHASVDKPVLHAYQATIIGGKLKFPKNEILDAKWFSTEEIRSMKNQLRNIDYILGSIEKLEERK